jgi:hypothetical protein
MYVAPAEWGEKIVSMNYIEIDEFYHSHNTMYKYALYFYNSLIMIKGNEVGPRTNAEIVIITIILVIDLFIAA